MTPTNHEHPTNLRETTRWNLFMAALVGTGIAAIVFLGVGIHSIREARPLSNDEIIRAAQHCADAGLGAQGLHYLFGTGRTVAVRCIAEESPRNTHSK